MIKKWQDPKGAGATGLAWSFLKIVSKQTMKFRLCTSVTSMTFQLSVVTEPSNSTCVFSLVLLVWSEANKA